MDDPFEIHKERDPRKWDKKQKQEASAAGAGSAVVANEARGAYQNHQVGQKGRQISNYQAKANTMGGVKSAKTKVKNGKITQASHAPGIHEMEMKTVNRYRSKPTPNANMDSLRSSIKSDGFKAPIHMTVYRKGGAKLWDGNHRAKVAAEQGFKSVPVSVTHSEKRKPIPTTLWAAKNEIKHAKYRRALTRVAKSEAEMTTSAFGVNHGYDDIEKAISFGSVTTGLKRMTGAAKSGFKGAVARPLPSKPAGAAFSAGAGARKATGATKSFLGTTQGKVATGVGAGGIGAGGFAASRRKR